MKLWITFNNNQIAAEPIQAQSEADAWLDLSAEIGEYTDTLRASGYTMVEYAPADKLEALVEAANQAIISLQSACAFDDTFLQTHRPLTFEIMQATQRKLEAALRTVTPEPEAQP